MHYFYLVIVRKKICEQIIGPPSLCVISCVFLFSCCAALLVAPYVFSFSCDYLCCLWLLGLSYSVYFLISLANQVVYKVLLFLFTEMNQLYNVSW